MRLHACLAPSGYSIYIHWCSWLKLQWQLMNASLLGPFKFIHKIYSHPLQCVISRHSRICFAGPIKTYTFSFYLKIENFNYLFNFPYIFSCNWVNPNVTLNFPMSHTVQLKFNDSLLTCFASPIEVMCTGVYALQVRCDVKAMN